MSKHRNQLQALGEFSINQWLAVGKKLGGAENVNRLLGCSSVGMDFTVHGAEVTGIESTGDDGSILLPHERFTLPACDTPEDPDEFFRNRPPGLEVNHRFFTDVLWEFGTKRGSLPAQQIAPFDLSVESTAYDGEIWREMGEDPNDFIFQDASVFVALLAGMIKAQKDGSNGPLRIVPRTHTNNVFYVRGKGTEVCAVSVFWFENEGKWWVSGHRRGDGHCFWRTGSRIFAAVANA